MRSNDAIEPLSQPVSKLLYSEHFFGSECAKCKAQENAKTGAYSYTKGLAFSQQRSNWYTQSQKRGPATSRPGGKKRRMHIRAFYCLHLVGELSLNPGTYFRVRRINPLQVAYRFKKTLTDAFRQIDIKQFLRFF